MARKIRIATFNCENLFARYNFKKKKSISTIAKEGFFINDTRFTLHNPKARLLTGRTIRALKADVVALQEVENMEVLRRFRSKRLRGLKDFPHVLLIDSHDPRRIDVALLSRHPIVHARTHQHVKPKGSSSYTFSRDCLEADVQIGGGRVTLFVNHFKSMMGGRSKSRKKREAQSQEVMRIVKNRFGDKLSEAPFVILGDMNDYVEPDAPEKSGITRLVQWDQVENVVDRLEESERWTHYFAKKKSYSQLDYLLVSRALTGKVKKVTIFRRGMPRRAGDFKQFKGVGQKNPKASDHCPLMVELEI